jgi:hypothetical protein
MASQWNVIYPYYSSLQKHPDGDFFSCAVRLSMALNHGNKFNKAGYKKQGYHVSQHGWAKVAEQLYQWLRLYELGAAQQIAVNPKDLSGIPQTNGIVYLRDCVLRDGQKGQAITSIRRRVGMFSPSAGQTSFQTDRSGC